MAARTVKCTLVNESPKHNLVLHQTDLPHGEWSAIGQPPARIPFGTEATWGSESCGIFTGTEGSATYWIGSTGARLRIYWNNPFCGDNKFTQTVIQPNPNDGLPGIPDYESFDPMRPNRVKTPAEQPIQFEDGTDIAVTYRLIQSEPVVAAPPAPVANPPAAGEPRVASAPPDRPTVVQCPPGFRKLLFFSLSPSSAYHEAKQLRAQVKNEDLTVINNITHAWVKNDAEFEKRTPLLNSKREKLKALEQAADLMEFTGPGYSEAKPLIVDPAMRIFTIRALAAELAQCDDDLNPNVDCNALKRVCFSGHHAAGWTNGRDDFLWGSTGHDSPPCVVLTLFKNSNTNGILAGLAEIFPKAFLRVEDLCYSACYTGWYRSDTDKCPIPDAMFKRFKNLSTLWVYKNSSPGAVNYEAGKIPPATSSNLAISEWEKASRTANAIDEIDKASLKIRKKLGDKLKGQGQSLVFHKGKMRPAPDPGQPQEPAACETPNAAVSA